MNYLEKLIFIDNEQHCEELCRILDSKYDITIAGDMKAAGDILRQSKANVSALLINANLQNEIWNAIEYVKNSNKLISIPILIFADENTPEDSFACLGSGVVDCICKPYISKIVKNRIANAISLTDSMSFYGIEALLKHLPSNIFLKDDECRYVFSTKYWHHLKKPDDDPNWTIRGLTDPEVRKDRDNALMAHKKDMEIIETGKGTTYTIEINEDGIQEFFQVIKQPLFNEEGFVTGIVGLINNTTEYELLKKKLREQAITDELTGLYNRAYLDEFIKTHDDDYYPLGIISADCDGLKEINDTYGHTAGDEYIKAAVSLFKQVLPKDSIMFRMGGDEFVILLPATSKEAVMHAAEQLRDTEKTFHIKDQELSISLGISVMASRLDGFDVCVAESDKNMYLEKKGKKKDRDGR
ncbi:MAG: diguanylate cyclase [Lachnospiraceae bacterium]|nr:diguanylate cyclase [Lachnospiraceae bacterium]